MFMRKKFYVVLGILLISGVAIGLSYTISQSSRLQNTPPPFPSLNIKISATKVTPTRPAHCVPLPSIETSSSIPTATPTHSITTSQILTKLTPTIIPSPAVSHTYDLSPNLSVADKSTIIIFRCDGTRDLYLLGPELDPDKAIILGQGDIILSSAPPASMVGHYPPTSSKSLTEQPSTMIPPYPAPPIGGQAKQVTQTPYPYP